MGEDTVIHKCAYVQLKVMEISTFHFLFNIFVIIMLMKAILLRFLFTHSN